MAHSIDSLIPLLEKPGIFFADSRKAMPGGLFFALKGENVDGHDFLPQIAQAQAFGAVVSENYRGDDFGLTLFRVPNVKEALQELAKKKRELFSSQKVIGITGSIGKTTTKEFIAAILSESFRVHKTKGSENSQVTLPLTLLNAELTAEWIVLEMGMSVKGEMQRLTEIAQPDIVVMTPIGYSHAGNFESLEEIAAEKAAILNSPRLKHYFITKEAAALIDPRQSSESIIYGIDDPTPPMPLLFDAAHLTSNLKGAIALARFLGMGWEEIRKACLKIEPFDRRFQRIVKKGVIFINDAYNASEASTVAAIKHLPKPEGEGKLIMVMGEMRELGRFSQEAHRKVGVAAGEWIDHLLTYGEETKWTIEACGKGERFEDKKTLLKRLQNLAKEGDVVLVKGANSLKMWTLIEEF